MAELALDYTALAMLGGLVVLSCFAFYALRILSNFRTGMLEKGWKWVGLGAVFLIFAQLLILISQLGVAELANPLILTGSALRVFAMILLVLGLREHYLVWQVDKVRPLPIEN